MSATTEVATAMDIRVIEQFLYREARLADEHEYDAWEELWTDDAVYWVPAGHGDVDPDTTMSVIYDTRGRLATRIAQLQTGKRHSQSPPSRLRRVISNVELTGTEEGDQLVEANFVLVESRERGKRVWAGRTSYRLREEEGELRLVRKRVQLVDADRDLPTLAFII